MGPQFYRHPHDVTVGKAQHGQKKLTMAESNLTSIADSGSLSQLSELFAFLLRQVKIPAVKKLLTGNISFSFKQ